MDLTQKLKECELKYMNFKMKLNKNPIQNFIYGNYRRLKKYYKMELEEIKSNL